MIIRGGVYEAMDAAFGTLWPWQTEWWVLHGGLLREDMNRTLPTYVHDKAVFPTAGLGLEPCGQARLSLSCLFTGWKQRPRVVTVTRPRLPSWRMEWAPALLPPRPGVPWPVCAGQLPIWAEA